MSFLNEIKRRKVFRLAAGYLVVAWVLVQVVDVIKEPLNLPEWFHTIVIVSLAIMFPIALMLSWAYDVTPEGVVRDDGSKGMAVRIDYGKIALGAVIVLGAFLTGSLITENQPPAVRETTDLRQFEISEPSDDDRRELRMTRNVILSPDGRSVVMQVTIAGESQLYLRRLKSLDIVPIEGTQGVRSYFDFSPDGRSLVFDSQDDNEIRIVSVDGGLSTPLGSLASPAHSISWGSGGSIAVIESAFDGLKLITVTGGEITTIGIVDDSMQYRHASFIPGSEWLVLSIGELGASVTPRVYDEIAVMSPGGEFRMTGIIGSSPRVSSDGYLIFYTDGMLMAAPFDLNEYRVTGSAESLVSDVYFGDLAHYDFSIAGSLVFRRASARGEQRLVWVDRSGKEENLPLPAGLYSHPEISPDGNVLAVTIEGPGTRDLWTFSLDRGEATRWTSNVSRETTKVFTPDGKLLYFESGQTADVYWISRDQPGQFEQLTNAESWLFPFSITSDGRYLFVDEWFGTVADGNNFGLIDLEGDRQFQYLLATDSRDSHPEISPDDTYLAYMSNVGGSLEIYVRRFPFDGSAPKRATVTGDSWQPSWNPNMRELFYWDLDDEQFYSLAIDVTSDIQFGELTPLFSTANYEFGGAGAYSYDKSRDKFVVIRRPDPGTTADEIILIENWTELLGN